MDEWLEAAYEDRFFVDESDEDDGFLWGWADEDDE